MDSLSSKSTNTTMSTAGEVHVGVDMAAVLMTGDLLTDKRRKMSISAVDEKGTPLDIVLLSDAIRMPTSETDYAPNTMVKNALDNPTPENKQYPVFETGKMLGNVPLVTEFHMESNRERIGVLDDGLDEEDLTAADGIFRKKKTLVVKRKSIIYDNIRMYKGEYVFPYKTYRPKVQVAYKVPPGQVPQAVVVERLHRIYKRSDINLVLQTLGVEPADLIPPPNYSENNERFYQEITFRNRVRVNGIFKKDFILSGGRLEDHQMTDEHISHLHAPKDEGSSSVSYATTSSEEEASSTLSTTSNQQTNIAEEHEAAEDDEDQHKPLHPNEPGDQGIHPFIKNKPPFGHMFPLHCFDNSEYDLRPALEWTEELSWDFKERRFYPLPAKAFLPLPGTPAKKNTIALSEVIVDHLLNSSPRLEKLYQWLLRERFQRTVKSLGLDPNKVKFSPTELDLTLLARVGSTVQPLSDEDAANDALRLRLGVEMKPSIVQEETEAESSLVVVAKPAHGEYSSDSTSSSQKRMTEMLEVEGQDAIPLHNVVYKKRVERLPDEESEDDSSDEDDATPGAPAKEKPKEARKIEAAKEEAKKLALKALEYAGEDEEETYADDIDEDTESRDYFNMDRHAKGYHQGDYGPVRPTSPDVDMLIDGHEKYVIDFDKMKKVHVHDWQWAEVAVFDYNPKTDKFYVKTIHAPIVHAWVDKIYLCFDGEDPNRHGYRIKDAVTRRIEMENLMRFNLYVDCLPVDNFPSMDPKIVDVIVSKSVSAPRINFTDKSLAKIQKEIDLEYKRTYARERFIHVTTKHPHLYKPWVIVPEEILQPHELDPEKEVKKLQDIRSDIPYSSFQYRVKKIQQLSVTFQKEPFEAFKKINEICLEAKRKSLILVDLEPLHLDEWEAKQKQNITEVRAYLKGEWYQSVVDTIREHLGPIPQSWYNLNESNYDVFLMSKLSNFLRMIRILMQDTLRSIVKESLERFIQRVQEVSKEVDLKKRFSWDEGDLITSLYPTPKDVSQIWALELCFDSEGPKYTQPLNNFARISSEMFNRAILSVRGFNSLLAQVMPQMSFESHEFLESPDESEACFQLLQATLQKYIKRALLPVDTYLQLYKKYQEYWSLDIPTFIKQWESEEHTAEDVQSLVEHHMAHVEQLEAEIPLLVNITGFKIVVEIVREELLRRKANLFTAIKESYALKLRKIIAGVREDYDEIEKKLNTRSDDIEEVMQLKKYVVTLPEQVDKMDELTTKVIKDYEVFDRFLYEIPEEDVHAKWQAAMLAGKALRLLRLAVKWLDEDYSRLLDVHQYDWSSLSDQVDYATLTVSGLIAFTELEKAPEVIIEVKKLWKQVRELQDQGALLNRRQKVFGLPPMQSLALERLGNDILPYKDLWFLAADWVEQYKTVFSGELEVVDIDHLNRVIAEGLPLMEKCADYFTEMGAEQIALIASTVKYQIEEFDPLIPLIRALKNKGMRDRHWEKISKICGFTVTPGGNMTFKDLLDQGIKSHIEIITKISDAATKESYIEFDMDRMAEGISRFEVKIDRDPQTSLPIIKLSDEAVKTMTEYIEKTSEILANPYNKPFASQLAIWDKKIRAARDNMEEWFDNQTNWLELEPMFKAPDIPTRLPVEFKLFEKMQRIWRRLIRLARDNPQLFELPSDEIVKTSIHQFHDLVLKMRKALEEHKKPKNSDEESD